MSEITPFDDLVNSHEQQLLKAAIPYLPADKQKFLSIYVKFSELMNTIRLMSNTEDSMLVACSVEEEDAISAIKKYCTKKEAEVLDNFLQMQQMFSLYKEMQNGTEDNQIMSLLSLMNNNQTEKGES